MDERRRNVRAKPRADLPSQVIREIAPGINDTYEIVDISVTGFALALHGDQDPLSETPKLKLQIGKTSFDVTAVVRWRAKGMMGLELTEVSDEGSKALRRYVSELLERG